MRAPRRAALTALGFPGVVALEHCPGWIEIDGRTVRCRHRAGHAADGATVFGFHTGEYKGEVIAWTDADNFKAVKP